MGYQMQHAHDFKLESESIKMEPSLNGSPILSIPRNRPSLPPIRQWFPSMYNDGNDTRRSSTSSVASCWQMTPEEPSPVGPIGNLDQLERATRRLNQLSMHIDFSPYPSPGSTPGPENHVIEKCKAKAKSRAVRGVAQTSGDGLDKELALEPTGRQKKVKANREKDARFELSQALARLWQECLKINPNFIREGVTKDGRRALRQLKRNNIDGRIEDAGRIPNQINKDHLVDLSTTCLGQFYEMTICEIEAHRAKGRYDEALKLESKLRRVGTYI